MKDCITRPTLGMEERTTLRLFGLFFYRRDGCLVGFISTLVLIVYIELMLSNWSYRLYLFEADWNQHTGDNI